MENVLILSTSSLKCRFCRTDKEDPERITSVSYGNILDPYYDYTYHVKSGKLEFATIKVLYAVVDCPNLECTQVLTSNPEGLNLTSLLVRTEEKTSIDYFLPIEEQMNLFGDIVKVELFKKGTSLNISDTVEKGTIICSSCGQYKEDDPPKPELSITYKCDAPVKGKFHAYWVYLKISCEDRQCKRIRNITESKFYKDIIRLKESKILDFLGIETASIEDFITYDSKETISKFLQILAQELEKEENKKLNEIYYKLGRLTGKNVKIIFENEEESNYGRST